MKIKTQSQLIKKLDRIFSKWIRYKHGDYVKCITCGKIEPPIDCDAGHWISRKYMIFRFDERNVHAQCRHCNRFCEGMKDDYTFKMIEMYGEKEVKKMTDEKFILKKYTIIELEEMIKHYTKLFNEI